MAISRGDRRVQKIDVHGERRLSAARYGLERERDHHED
jgi:hypothetical protein